MGIVAVWSTHETRSNDPPSQREAVWNIISLPAFSLVENDTPNCERAIRLYCALKSVANQTQLFVAELLHFVTKHAKWRYPCVYMSPRERQKFRIAPSGAPCLRGWGPCRLTQRGPHFVKENRSRAAFCKRHTHHDFPRDRTRRGAGSGSARSRCFR